METAPDPSGAATVAEAAALRALRIALVAIASLSVALIVILLLVQIWLLTATLENFLAGFRETTLPAAILSGLIFAACIGLYLFINGIDLEHRKR